VHDLPLTGDTDIDVMRTALVPIEDAVSPCLTRFVLNPDEAGG
jgi:hypothetical protein